MRFEKREGSVAVNAIGLYDSTRTALSFYSSYLADFADTT